MQPMTPFNVQRRRFLAQCLTFAAAIIGPTLGFSQDGTRGMKRRQGRRDDRGDRIQKRDDKFVERRDDPIGVRGPQRREDRRDVKADRRERVL